MHQPDNRVKAIFDQALGIGSLPERAAYLDKACAGAPEVRKEVEALLEAAAGAANPVRAAAPSLEPRGASPAWQRVDGACLPEEEKRGTTQALTVEAIGARIGPYHLVQQLGEGRGKGDSVLFRSPHRNNVRCPLVCGSKSPASAPT